MADRDTILERFDKDPVFKEWEEPKSFKVLAEHSFLRCSYQLPVSMIDSSTEAGVSHGTCQRPGFPRILRIYNGQDLQNPSESEKS